MTIRITERTLKLTIGIVALLLLILLRGAQAGFELLLGLLASITIFDAIRSKIGVNPK